LDTKLKLDKDHDESIIIVFYLIFKFILFRFNMFLFPSRTILLQLQVILFYEQIFERWSLRAKERIIEADSCQKYEDLIQKYLVQGFMSKI